MRGRALLLLAIVALASGCSSGSSGHTSLSVRFLDRVARSSCPRGAPAGAECFLLRSHARARGFGSVTTGPTLDVEAPQSSPACGARTSFLQRLQFGDGALTAKVIGPRLCLYRMGRVRRRFTIVHGSGAFAGATGSGTVTIDVESVGATETWHGTLAGLHH